jgi:hypothetical protein
MFLLDLIKAANPALETALFLVVLWLLYRAVTGSWRVWQLAVGIDGRYSTSLFQGLAWTLVVGAGYLVLFLARVHVGTTQALGDLPANVVTALGLSLGTTVTAAGITSGRVSRDPDYKQAATPAGQSLASLVEDDQGDPSLVKTQLMLWTIVALGIYVVALADAVSRTLAVANGTPPPGLPDIDTTLLVLSGIGQATYLTHKIVAAPRAQVDAAGLAASVTSAVTSPDLAGTASVPPPSS